MFGKFLCNGEKLGEALTQADAQEEKERCVPQTIREDLLEILIDCDK